MRIEFASIQCDVAWVHQFGYWAGTMDGERYSKPQVAC